MQVFSGLISPKGHLLYCFASSHFFQIFSVVTISLHQTPKRVTLTNNPSLLLNVNDHQSWKIIYELTYEKTGLNLNSYRDYQIAHWIFEYRTKFRCSTFEELKQLLLDENFDFEELIGALLINRTEPFRDPDQWEMLREIISKRHYSTFKGLSAGCSYGGEAASLALVVHEHLPLDLIKIVGIDRDQAAFNQASLGVFPVFPSQYVHTPYQSFFQHKAPSSMEVSREILERIEYIKLPTS